MDKATSNGRTEENIKENGLRVNKKARALIKVQREMNAEVSGTTVKERDG